MYILYNMQVFPFCSSEFLPGMPFYVTQIKTLKKLYKYKFKVDGDQGKGRGTVLGLGTAKNEGLYQFKYRVLLLNIVFF